MDSDQAALTVAILSLLRGALPIFLLTSGFFVAKECFRLCGFGGGEKVQL